MGLNLLRRAAKGMHDELGLSHRETASLLCRLLFEGEADVADAADIDVAVINAVDEKQQQRCAELIFDAIKNAADRDREAQVMQRKRNENLIDLS
jgi:hypothetical protein